jgi:hypothetical protein
VPTPLARALAQRERLPPRAALSPLSDSTSAGDGVGVGVSIGTGPGAADDGASISALRETIARILALEGEAPG